MATTKKKTTKKKATAKKAKVEEKSNFLSNSIITDIINFHKVKDGCTLTLLILEAWLLWSLASNLF
tara:strand:+ start:370 stop:567 length:198 start_codon:yes stop_codon:yes gene_type:complete